MGLFDLRAVFGIVRCLVLISCVGDRDLELDPLTAPAELDSSSWCDPGPCMLFARSIPGLGLNAVLSPSATPPAPMPLFPTGLATSLVASLRLPNCCGNASGHSLSCITCVSGRASSPLIVGGAGGEVSFCIDVELVWGDFGVEVRDCLKGLPEGSIEFSGI